MMAQITSDNYQNHKSCALVHYYIPSNKTIPII